MFWAVFKNVRERRPIQARPIGLARRAASQAASRPVAVSENVGLEDSTLVCSEIVPRLGKSKSASNYIYRGMSFEALFGSLRNNNCQSIGTFGRLAL